VDPVFHRYAVTIHRAAECNLGGLAREPVADVGAAYMQALKNADVLAERMLEARKRPVDHIFNPAGGIVTMPA
jgi:hypothetical protein